MCPPATVADDVIGRHTLVALLLVACTGSGTMSGPSVPVVDGTPTAPAVAALPEHCPSELPGRLPRHAIPGVVTRLVPGAPTALVICLASERRQITGPQVERLVRAERPEPRAAGNRLRMPCRLRSDLRVVLRLPGRRSAARPGQRLGMSLRDERTAERPHRPDATQDAPVPGASLTCLVAGVVTLVRRRGRATS